VASARVEAEQGKGTDHILFPQSSLAGIARATICYGNEYRSRSFRDIDLRNLCSAFINISDPFLEDRDVGRFLVRTAHEQFQLQGGLYNDVARTQALLVEAAASSGSLVITPEFWRDLLGCSTQDLFACALVLHTGASKHQGEFNPSWLGQSNFVPVFHHVSRPTIEAAFSQHFCANVSRHRSFMNVDLPSGDLERYALNPLRIAPFVTQQDLLPLAPVLPLIWCRATPQSLYFTASHKHGATFTDALGPVFEHYVGQQLELTGGVVLPEIEYGPPKARKKSTDFMVVLPKAVILVEAKATPTTADGRRAGPQLESNIDRAPGKAIQQIGETARLIRERHPSFTGIPADRPIVGLVVTMEPYYLLSLPSPDVPTWLASASDLEHLVSTTSMPIDDALLRHPRDGSAKAVHAELLHLEPGRNEILDRAWHQLPFGQPQGEVSAAEAPPESQQRES
jgi:hypothetical protein